MSYQGTILQWYIKKIIGKIWSRLFFQQTMSDVQFTEAAEKMKINDREKNKFLIFSGINTVILAHLY